MSADAGPGVEIEVLPEVTARLAAARHLGRVPLYGSAEYEALHGTDPRRIASMARAAECWRLDGEREAIAERFRTELAEADALVAHRFRQASHELSAATDWGRIAASQNVTAAELAERRRYEAVA